jgi:hypothetical protein
MSPVHNPKCSKIYFSIFIFSHDHIPEGFLRVTRNFTAISEFKLGKYCTFNPWWTKTVVEGVS